MGGVSCWGAKSNSQLNSTPYMLPIATYKTAFKSIKTNKTGKRRAKSGGGGVGGVAPSDAT